MPRRCGISKGREGFFTVPHEIRRLAKPAVGEKSVEERLRDRLLARSAMDGCSPEEQERLMAANLEAFMALEEVRRSSPALIARA
jgi:hypothetical protein